VTKSKVSLRDEIVNDRRLNNYFWIVKKQEPGRAPGWARLRSINKDSKGTIQLKWDAKTKMLLCSIVNKANGRPADIVGELISYLLSNFQKKIRVINILSN